jgi:tetratricopeptide (TPR) repeat protein
VPSQLSSPDRADDERPEAPPEQIYRRIRDQVQSDPGFARGTEFEAAREDLRRIANEADDAHLRANASLLLGELLEAKGEGKQAIDHYRHATRLVSDDAGPFMALALALAKDEQFAEAAEVQHRATELDPDNLENWLALGEMRLGAGESEASAEAYVAYERRRKGLIDGLTLKRGDAYRIAPTDRAGCAEALASAADPGTAVALIYALKSDPDPEVRATIAAVMGVQRLAMYRPVLEDRFEIETDAAVKQALAAALAEVVRAPVELQPAREAADAQ